MRAMEWMDYSCRPASSRRRPGSYDGAPAFAGVTITAPEETPMIRRPSKSRRQFIQAGAAAAASALLPFTARAADPVKVGLILPLTGPFASTGRQVEAAVRLYLAKNGDTVSGQKIELLVRDDTGLAPETTKRIAQELVSRDHVTFLSGFGLTPLAFAAAPVATEAK